MVHVRIGLKKHAILHRHLSFRAFSALLIKFDRREAHCSQSKTLLHSSKTEATAIINGIRFQFQCKHSDLGVLDIEMKVGR